MTPDCQCTGCIHPDCGKCQACRESNGGLCLLRRCQRFAYLLASEEKWQKEVHRVNSSAHCNARSAKTLPRYIQSTKQSDRDPHHNTVPILPKSLSTIHEDIKVTRPKAFPCGTCSQCLLGACQICSSCLDTTRKKKCPFLVCEDVAYSIHQIKSAERMARRAFQAHPQRLLRGFESLYGVDGFMTRQKTERQKEKESLYNNMFGEKDDTPHRHIMLRSRFPRTPKARKTDDDSIVRTSTSSWNDNKIAKVTPCQVLNDTKRSQNNTWHTSDTCEIFADNPSAHSLDCRSLETGHKRKVEDDTYAIQKAKIARTNRYDDFASSRLKLPPKQLFVDPLNDKVAPLTSLKQEPKNPCPRCRIVTVRGLCFDCNRIQNINSNDILFSHAKMDPAKKARVMQYIQSSLRVSTMKNDFSSGASSVHNEQTKLKVKFDDSSYEYMERLWRDRDHLYLFGDRILRHPASFVAGIDASTRRDGARRKEDEVRGNDGGGPTRQFLSMFWRYLPNVTVTNKIYGKFSLFEETNTTYLRPLCDDKIYRLMEDYYKLEETSIYRCYRALGRMIGFCILHQFHINHNVLSKIHRNYLFRGASPKDSFGTNVKDTLCNNLGTLLDCEADKVINLDQRLRDDAYEIYIEQNMIFLEAVKEGMRLEVMTAETIPETFSCIDPSLIDELFFGTTTFDVEDLIAALRPVYAGEAEHGSSDPNIINRLVIQKKTLRRNGMGSQPEGAFVNVIRSLNRCNKDFLTTFVLYVTGYEYLPAAHTINIEFNYKEMPSNDALPVSHTCVNTLKLPGLAYNANEDLIREKLSMALSYLKQSKLEFNMK
ncbi:hypothetical protein FisN_20Lh100 [Fistulifera solaris]|uniref:HECT domain-containing protein n=1 Tax=Fistulifera solaris TaxID=1519565 RepID=A0A1Z5JCW1_FISSO|nr:hypothetical protein FisN_20Lh100 [Fistulifera solaris]|eukprot:GAX11843.1 hypothetical protein FisN_20Lh100 [Fistulifera solaris]